MTNLNLLKNKKFTSIVPVEKNNDLHLLRAKKISNQCLKPYIKPKKKFLQIVKI
jgi:hypothetical protein